MDSNPTRDQWIREKGAELEAAFREAGSSLPEGLSGEMLVRGALEEGEREFNSPAGKARSERIRAIAQEVAAELPGGHEHPDYAKQLGARLEWLFKEGQDGAGVCDT